MLRLGIQKGFVLLDLVSLPQEWKGVFGGFFPCLKPSGLHFGVKVLIKPFYKSNHLETHNVWYTCFSLDFSCVTCSYSQIFFFFKELEGCKYPNPVGNRHYILFHVNLCTSNRAL